MPFHVTTRQRNRESRNSPLIRQHRKLVAEGGRKPGVSSSAVNQAGPEHNISAFYYFKALLQEKVIYNIGTNG